MSFTIKVLLFAGLIFSIFTSCSTPEIATSDAAKDTAFPSWYSPSGFSADSLAFHGFATAVSSDSVIAMANAMLQARANLENGVAVKMEDVREDLEQTGSSNVTNTDFILTLRNAHNEVQQAAQPGNRSARNTDDYYTGFAQVTLTKSELRTIMESGFQGHPNYWKDFSTSSAFEKALN
ncbi:MAG: hypothetical protein WD361_14010 [Gracilimonas sp.]